MQNLTERDARAFLTHLVTPGLPLFDDALAAVDGNAAELVTMYRAKTLEPELQDLLSSRHHRELKPEGAAEHYFEKGIEFLVPGDEHWPAKLDALGPAAPLGLWFTGAHPEVLNSPSLIVTGARASTSYAEHVAQGLATELATEHGFTTLTGGAFGVDAAALRAALTAGRTAVTMLAGGVDRPYPAAHTALFGRVRDNGGLVSEAVPATPPTKTRFLRRAQLLAAMADAVIIVEAGAQSGTLGLAHHARTLGKPIGVVPGAVTEVSNAGGHGLIRDGHAELVTCTSDIVELLERSEPIRAAL